MISHEHQGVASTIKFVVFCSFHCSQFVNCQSCYINAAINSWDAQGYETLLNVINKLYAFYTI